MHCDVGDDIPRSPSPCAQFVDELVLPADLSCLQLCRMVLQLYRNIVRTHRNVLPPPLRAMGDTYARDEFRRHWTPKTTKSQWQAFVQEWQRYLSMLQGQADLQEQSGDIPDNVLDSLNAGAEGSAGSPEGGGSQGSGGHHDWEA